jgi:hypothetical protein
VWRHTCGLAHEPMSAPTAHVPAPAAAEATAVCAAGQRLFAHELLATEPVCVPEQADRIATLEPAAHDLLMALTFSVQHLDVQHVICYPHSRIFILE